MKKMIIFACVIVLSATSCMAQQRTSGSISLKSIKNAIVEKKNAGDVIVYGQRELNHRAQTVKIITSTANNPAEIINAATMTANEIQRMSSTATSMSNAAGTLTGNKQGNSKVQSNHEKVTKAAWDARDISREAAGINGAIQGILEWGKILKK